MIKFTLRGSLASLAAILVAQGCAPAPIPDVDSGADVVQSDTNRPDTNRPDTVVQPEAGPEAGSPDVLDEMSPMAEAGTEAGVELDAGMDAGAEASVDAGTDVVSMDSRDGAADVVGADAADGAIAPGCSRTVDATLAFPAAGMTTTVMSSLAAMGTGGMNPSLGCVSGTNGSERVFRLTVPARTGVVLTATAALATTDLVMAIRRNCTASGSEVACNDDSSGLNPGIRTMLDAGEYFVVVDEYAFTAMEATGGDFTLSLGTYTPAANPTCATAAALTPGMAAMGNTNGGEVPMMTCSSFNSGPQVFYSITIPANHQASIVATPSGMPAWAPFLRVIDTCAAGVTCLGTQFGAAGMPTNGTFANRTATARTVLVSVGSSNAANGGAFSLSYTTAMIPAAAANATCAMPTALTLPTTALAGSTISGMETRSSSCAASTFGGPLSYYTLSVPAGRSILINAAPRTAGFNPAVHLFDGCAATSCAGFRDSAPIDQPERLTYTNATLAAQNLTLAIGSRTTTQEGSFALDVSLLPNTTANTTCAAAIPLPTSNGVLSQQQQNVASTRSTATCEAGSTGNVLYYSLTIPAGQQALITASPLGPTTANAVLRVRTDCATAACVGSSNTTGSNAAENLTIRNDTMAPAVYIVELGSASSTSTGIFDLAVSYSRIPYSVTAIATANCDDLSMGATSLMLNGDDEASTVRALPMPFAFSYFGDAVSHFGANTNGLAQLFSNSMGIVSTSFGNVDLPSATGPVGALSVFWDDLEVDTMSRPGAAVRFATLGTAPNRRVVLEWFNANTLGGTDTLRFQVKLNETSNTVEYHYCAMTDTAMGSTFHLGSSATIGMQNLARDRATVFSHNTASIGLGTAMSPNRLLFIPR
ncbi:MAG: hypothetical protein Q8Q09_28570 [Deltaproteobacteria bacterium]|nr:hypothetical protein [Deltaproteobacteria bacterium]